MPEMKINYVGKPVPRVDALDKVTGHAVYGFDVERPGMLYGATLRSPFAHAKIIEINGSEASRAPGVRAVVTGNDFPYTFGSSIKDQPFFATDRVRYVGEPLAAVAAETEAAAQEALEKIRVRYEELPPVFDPRESMAEGAPLLHPNLEKYTRGNIDIVPGTNICTICTYSLGNVEAGLAEADEVFEDEFSAHALSHALMETHAAVAQYSPLGGEYTIWTSTDRPYLLVRELTDALGIPVNRVRFIVPYVGASFGGKNTLMAERIAIALARFTKGRPVKVVFSREEDLTGSETRVAALMKLTTGVKRDGTLTARKADIVWDSGAYVSNSPGVVTRGAHAIFGPYRIANLELVSKQAYTNKEVSSSYRGYGSTQVAWACESQMDIIAKKLEIDPLEIRLKNGYVEGDRWINGQVLHGVGLSETLEKARREIGWGKVKQKPSGTKRRGKGIATMLKGTLTPSSSCCFIRVNQDASVTVLCSSPEIGGGQKTVFSQIAADTIGVPLGSISIPNPDTHVTPFDTAVASSRTTYHMGNAILRAGHQARKKILELAGNLLETDPARLSLSEGKVFEEDVGERITLKALMAKKFGARGADEILGEAHFTPADSPLLAASPGLIRMSSIFWMYATHAAEVEVDTETGVVKVLKVAAAHDVGRAINPMGCNQQIEGGVIMGLSNALFEEFKMEGGQILNDTLADYKLATMLDVPKIVPIIVEAHHTEGPFGAKGIGEPAAACTPPAIANAIFDAVGIRINGLPITPEKVLAALREKERKS
jgi:carbon-monoxide dehydrogenase large subunit